MSGYPEVYNTTASLTAPKKSIIIFIPTRPVIFWSKRVIGYTIGPLILGKGGMGNCFLNCSISTMGLATKLSLGIESGLVLPDGSTGGARRAGGFFFPNFASAIGAYFESGYLSRTS